MLSHSGIIMFKKGNRQAGLVFEEGLSPYEFPSSLFKFMNLFKDSTHLDSFNNYFDNLNIVSVSSEINEDDKIMLSKQNEEIIWKNLSDFYTENHSDLFDLLFSASFKELPDVSSLIVPIEDSELSFLNHFYIIDLEENKISHFIGGLGFNFNRSLCFEINISDISDDLDFNCKYALNKYSELLKNKYGTIN